MAAGYVVTGFGTTYFGGNRDTGLFDLDAQKNDIWEAQLGHVRRMFLQTQWSKLESHDELLSRAVARFEDGKEFNQTVPPATTYWCLADSGKMYIDHAMGLKSAVLLSLGSSVPQFSVERFDPRTGEVKQLGGVASTDRFEFYPPGQQDGLAILTAKR